MSKASCELPPLHPDYQTVHQTVQTRVATRLRSTHSDSAHISHHSLCMEEPLLLNQGNIITVLNSSEHPPSWPHCPYYGNIITVLNSSEHLPHGLTVRFMGTSSRGDSISHHASRTTKGTRDCCSSASCSASSSELLQTHSHKGQAPRTSTQDKHIGQAHTSPLALGWPP
jgi:hypothetical protein